MRDETEDQLRELPRSIQSLHFCNQFDQSMEKAPFKVKRLAMSMNKP